MGTNQLDAVTKQEDMDMLSLVVDAALRDESIAETFPAFYQRMMADMGLYQLFADMMAVIRDKSPVPDFGTANLSFLHRDISKKPLIKEIRPNFWEATWSVFASMLDQFFMPASPVYRSANRLLDAESTLLIYNEFEAGGERWEATLEALAQPAAPNQMELFLTVLSEQEPLPSLQATVRWGDYRQTAVLDTFGRAHFPPFAVERILNETETAVSHDLNLQLHPIR